MLNFKGIEKNQVAFDNNGIEQFRKISIYFFREFQLPVSENVYECL